MRIIIPVIISLSLLYNAIIYELGGIHLAFTIISAILSFVFFSKGKLIEHLPSLVILFYCYLSTSFLSFSHLVPPIWTDLDLQRIAELGSKIYLVAVLSVFAVDLIHQKYTKKYTNSLKPYRITDRQVKVFFVLSYFLSIISYVLGVSVMGAESRVLPFHLSGVLHDYRTVFAPSFFMLIVENRIIRKKNIPHNWYLLFVVWCLFEAFLRISKSFLVFGMMPVGIYLILYYKPSFKKLLVYLVPFTIAALFIYAIMGTMRGATSATISGLEEAQRKQSEIETSEEWGNPLVGSFNRMFMTGMDYRKDYFEFNHNDLFDFSRAPGIILIGGTARYRTYILHNQQMGRHNSDGTTGIIDPLLWGGFGFCYIVLFIYIIAAKFAEKHIKGRLSLLVLWSLVFLSFMSDGTISWVLSQNVFSLYVTRFIVIFLSIRLNYNYRSKQKNNKYLVLNDVLSR